MLRIALMTLTHQIAPTRTLCGQLHVPSAGSELRLRWARGFGRRSLSANSSNSNSANNNSQVKRGNDRTQTWRPCDRPGSAGLTNCAQAPDARRSSL